MNSLNDEELNRISKLRQKLYSRSLTENASKLNALRKHSLKVPSSWEEEVIPDAKSPAAAEAPRKESVSDFLNKRFDNITTNEYSQKRVSTIENKIEMTNSELKIAQAKLNSRVNDLYPNLKRSEPKKTLTDIVVEPAATFQSDYHPKMNTINVGDPADLRYIKVPEKKNKRNFTFGFSVFMIIFFFFVGAGFYTYVNLSQGTNTISTSKLDIKVTGPVTVKSGEVSDFIVDITNNNTTDLILSDLIIQYPTGSKSPNDRSVDLTNERISVGTIKPGQTVRQKNSVVFFGEQNVKKNIRYSYEFNINDSATIFKTDKDVGVVIAGSPILVTVENVKEINNNQELIFDIDLGSNSEEQLKNIQLKVEYPFGYKLLEASPKPSSDDNTWSFASIEPLSSTTIRLKGKFVGEVNVDKNFRFTLGIEDAKTKEMLTVLTTQDTQVAIRRPFVVTKLLIDGDNSDFHPVGYDENLKADLVVTNNLKDVINDVEIEVLFGGVLINRGSIKSGDGFYDSNKDVILWDKSLNKALTSIAPGETRELSFNIATLGSSDSLIKTLRRAVSDLTINVKAQRLGENRVPESIAASTKKQLRLKTEVVMASNLAYVSGTYSPEVNKEVVYRYIGNISNTANTVKGTVFMAKLPPNATWKNVYSPNIPTSSVKYNTSTREITITLGDIEAGSGTEKVQKEFYFQIGFIPTLTQTGQSPTTVMNPTLTTTDSFTNEKLQVKTSSMTTAVTTGTNSDVSGRVK